MAVAGLVSVAGWLLAVAPAALGAPLRIRPATPAETSAMEQAANAVQGCGFTSKRQYLWPVEVASDGWALADPESRNPKDQGNGFLLLHDVGGRWHYVTCGSSFFGQATSYPSAVARVLENAMPGVKVATAPPAVARALAAATTSAARCAGQRTSRLGPIEVTDIGGWAAAVLDGTPGRTSGECVVLYHVVGHRWTVVAHGRSDGIWTSAYDVPAVVLYELQTATDKALLGSHGA